MIMQDKGMRLTRYWGKVMASSLLFSCLGLFSSLAVAQLPELGSPSTGSGVATTAKFFGGATADSSNSFASSFSGEQPLDIFTEVQVESGHVNTVGNIYLLIQLGKDIFMRLESGEYVIWDQTLENLQATLPGRTLQASEPITILENVAFGPAGLAGATLSIFLAYDTTAVSGELYYSGVPLTVAIEAEVVAPVPEPTPEPTPAAEPVLASLTFYLSNISQPIVQSRCVVCHIGGGAASSSAMLFVGSSAEGYQQSNYNTLLNYIQSAPNGDSLIVSKPQGTVAHGGGVQLAPGSAGLADWSSFIASALAEITNNGSGSD